MIFFEHECVLPFGKARTIAHPRERAFRAYSLHKIDEVRGAAAQFIFGQSAYCARDFKHGCRRSPLRSVSSPLIRIRRLGWGSEKEEKREEGV